MPYEDINHSVDGIFLSAYIAQFFGGLLQRSMEQQTHVYNNPGRHPLVYWYPMKRGLAFEQFYIIPSANHWTDKDLNNTESGWTATENVRLRGSSIGSLQ
jgi:hypothetical protein